MNPNESTGTVAVIAVDPAEHRLTSAELEQARLYLLQTRSYIIGAIKGLSEAQWKFKPASDRWSIAENVDHILVVQELVLGPVRAQLATAPVSTAVRDYKQVDEIVLGQFPNRLSKFQAPEAVQPADRWTPGDALDRLRRNYERLTEYLESTPDLRQRLRESPPLKAISNGAFQSMDGYQWVLAAAAHTERHVKQILEVMAEPDFPGR